MARAFLVVMDSVGIGGAPDAGTFFNGDLPDTGANTLAHVAQARSGGLRVPTLDALGLGAALRLASGEVAEGLGAAPRGLWGAATARARGKDTTTGHWELAGLELPFEWHYFPDTRPAFPDEVVAAVTEAAGTGGILGNCHASGTEIVTELGQAHIETGWPICYTSADSVFQIAAHEAHFGLERLLALCEAVAPMLHGMRVGRVIARPFVGETPQTFARTGNRRDYALPPPGPTLCDRAQAEGRAVHGIGKIGDIFAMQGIDDVRKGSDAQLMEHLARAVEEAGPGSLTFANFVEFDSLYGHRRDPEGYAAALERFDAGLGEVLPKLGPGDLMLITADHGNDPTWPGTDHTRERVPVLGAGVGNVAAGLVDFVDVAATVAAHLGLGWRGPGRSFLP
ncbi:MAG: phosphopentomutase [Roseovarius sp.]